MLQAGLAVGGWRPAETGSSSGDLCSPLQPVLGHTPTQPPSNSTMRIGLYTIGYISKGNDIFK